MAAEQFTELKPPPEYRGGPAESYVFELFRWLQTYHLTLEPLVKQCIQLKADISGLGKLTQSITSPPTQAEVQAIQAKLNAIIEFAGE